MREQEAQTFPLAEMTMNFLRKGQGRTLKFCPQAPQGIQAALDALFASGSAARPALEELIRLVCVLQDERASHAAASVILAVLSGDARAIRALGGSTEADARYVRTRLSEFFGKEVMTTAPKVGAAAPSGALKASSLNASRRMGPPPRPKKIVAKPAPQANKAPKKRGKKTRAVISADGVVMPQR